MDTADMTTPEDVLRARGVPEERIATWSSIVAIRSRWPPLPPPTSEGPRPPRGRFALDRRVVEYECGRHRWSIAPVPFFDRNLRRMVNFMLRKMEPDEMPHGWAKGDYVASFGEVTSRTYDSAFASCGFMVEFVYRSAHHDFGGSGEGPDGFAAATHLLDCVAGHLQTKGWL